MIAGDLTSALWMFFFLIMKILIQNLSFSRMYKECSTAEGNGVKMQNKIFKNVNVNVNSKFIYFLIIVCTNNYNVFYKIFLSSETEEQNA